MGSNKLLHYFLSFILLFGTVGGLIAQPVFGSPVTNSGATVVPANDTQPGAADWLEVICQYPSLQGNSGDSFKFSMELSWHATSTRTFDVSAKGPDNWTVAILAGIDGQKISNIITLKPLETGQTYPTETLAVTLTPVSGSQPAPGNYDVNFQISSGNISQQFKFTAVVVAKYGMTFTPSSGSLHVQVTAGQDNHMSMLLTNTGTAPITNISLLSQAPTNWAITYTPSEVATLQAGESKEIDVNIRPPRDTVAGDWSVTLEATSPGLPWQEPQIRVTVLTPSTLGWVVVGVILVVIGGLGVIFWRLGRR